MSSKTEPVQHTRVNAVARTLNRQYPSLTFEAIRRSVLRHWPDKDKYLAEVAAKDAQPCVIGLQIVGAQQDYVEHVQHNFYPVSAATAPYFGAPHSACQAGAEGPDTWATVKAKLNDPATPRVHWISASCPVGVVPSVECFEELYERVILAEGVRDLVGVAHACDGTIPFGDYISLRLAGGTCEQVSQLMNFATLSEEASTVTQRMADAGETGEEYIIAADGEEHELFEAAAAEACVHHVLQMVVEEDEKEGRRPATVARLRERIGAKVTAKSAEILDLAFSARMKQLDAARAEAALACLDTGTAATLMRSPLYRHLNLYGNDPATAISWRENKAGMHCRLREVGLNHIRSLEADNPAMGIARMADIGIDYPVVVKPVSGAGSEFVTLCHRDADVVTAFAICAHTLTTQRTAASRMVVEEYIHGQEYVVNVVSFEGRHAVTDVWKSWKYPKTCVSTRLRGTVEMQLKERAAKDASVRVPEAVTSTSLLYDRLEFVTGLAELSPSSQERRVVDYTLTAITALGMVNGCSHCEVRVDERPASATVGQPVLIELNPRMQGDAPRATQLVGYDQYTLLFYISAAAAAYETPKREPVAPHAPRTLLHPGDRCSLPWPPVPPLYRSLQQGLAPGQEPITRHVVFLIAPEPGVVCRFGARQAMTLKTFLRTTRNDVFTAPRPGFLTTVHSTVDLYSSPGAIVLEGTASDIRADTSRLRELERAVMPEESRQCFMRAAPFLVRVTEATREASKVRESVRQLRARIHSGSVTLHAARDGRVAQAVEVVRGESDEEGPTETMLCEEQLRHLAASIASDREYLKSLEDAAEVAMQHAERLRREMHAMIKIGMNALASAETPPLYVSMSDFHLMRSLDLGDQLILDAAPPTKAAERLTLIKDARLQRAYDAACSDEPSRSMSRPSPLHALSSCAPL